MDQIKSPTSKKARKLFNYLELKYPEAIGTKIKTIKQRA
jgi:hypothetical protein